MFSVVTKGVVLEESILFRTSNLPRDEVKRPTIDEVRDRETGDCSRGYKAGTREGVSLVGGSKVFLKACFPRALS